MSDDDILSEDDLETWQYVSRTVTPLPGKKIAPSKPEKEIKEIYPNNQVSQEDLAKLVESKKEPSAKSYQYIKHGETEGIDKSTAKRLKEGKYNIDAKLDMHGRTQDEALEGLRYFIRTSYEMRKRCVLVVTGKGANNDGVLKNQVPRWLNNPGIREYILGFSYATVKHGGEGALYVLIKRHR